LRRLLSTPGQNLTLPPVENLTVRRGDEPQFVAASWRRRRRFDVGSGSGVCSAWQRPEDMRPGAHLNLQTDEAPGLLISCDPSPDLLTSCDPW